MFCHYQFTLCCTHRAWNRLYAKRPDKIDPSSSNPPPTPTPTPTPRATWFVLPDPSLPRSGNRSNRSNGDIGLKVTFEPSTCHPLHIQASTGGFLGTFMRHETHEQEWFYGGMRRYRFSLALMNVSGPISS